MSGTLRSFVVTLVKGRRVKYNRDTLYGYRVQLSFNISLDLFLGFCYTRDTFSGGTSSSLSDNFFRLKALRDDLSETSSPRNRAFCYNFTVFTLISSARVEVRLLRLDRSFSIRKVPIVINENCLGYLITMYAGELISQT